jgi:hypothetical protein
MKTFKTILAIILTVPIMLTSGVLFFIVNDPSDGRTTEEWKAYMWKKWYIAPALWCHLWMVCGGDYTKQRR